jgi:energy-coupling factor transporter transmembrane protein EcfT
MLMTAVTAAENVGPIGIISRSWELTRGHFWKLLGFALLVFVVFMVVSLVVGAIGGIVIVLLAGVPAPGSFAAFLIMLVGALVNMVMTVYFTTLLVRIYVQLTGSSRESVFV